MSAMEHLGMSESEFRMDQRIRVQEEELGVFRKDKARLDWLLKRGIPQEPGERHSATWTREAVDKAMERIDD